MPPTTEQRAVLESRSRHRLVRAAPGSGKTWLVGQIIADELGRWDSSTSGIAALSFTRVGGDEIRKAVGYEPTHPHFVGTIDAFLFRFVIRPFLRKCYPWFAEPRLVPAEWGAVHWRRCSRDVDATAAQGINLFGCVYIGEDGDEPILAHKPHPAGPLQRLVGTQLEQVKGAKLSVWQRTGQLSHSDAAMWASEVLGHPQHGAVIRAEVLRRFPLLIVDELQDTGHYLGKSIKALLAEASSRSVLVGDPDQAIFEFNGARPDLFAQFEAIAGGSLPLPNSRRCSVTVCGAASHLRHSGGTFGSSGTNNGRAILIQFADMVPDVRRIVEALKRHRPRSSMKVIARRTATIDQLGNRQSYDARSLHCRPLTHMHRAVVAFRKKRNTAAFAEAKTAIDLTVFGHEGVTPALLAENGIDERQWRQSAVSSLLAANAAPNTGTFFDWQTNVASAIDAALQNLNLNATLGFSVGQRRPQRRPGWDTPVADLLPALGSPVAGSVESYTVHSVKGETHDVTVFVVPSSSVARCPSSVWWSEAHEHREERRIAYVAMTRSQGDLIVCVSQACGQRLANTRPAFVASFETKTVDAFIADLEDIARGGGS